MATGVFVKGLWLHFFVAIITSYEHRAGELQGRLVHPLISNYAYMSDGQDHLSLSV